jgi:hypothetical protein
MKVLYNCRDEKQLEPFNDVSQVGGLNFLLEYPTEPLPIPKRLFTPARGNAPGWTVSFLLRTRSVVGWVLV